MSSFDFEKSIEEQMLQPIPIPNKMQYYMDIRQIEYSFSGFFDATFANTLIMESARLLINAIALFERGYFDVAFYSLRQAIEMSTTFVYLYDLPVNKRDEMLKQWKATAVHFPMRGDMNKELAKDGRQYADMKQKMPTFFNDTEDVNKKLNKYVHKQGLRFLYIARNRTNPETRIKIQKKLSDNFICFLEKCIGIVAVFRLAIDPFPILLSDEKILNRCCNLITDPYTDDFIQKYIGDSVLKEYYQTKFYLDVYNELIKKEEKNEGTLLIAKDEFIERSLKDDILTQWHLLTWIERCVVTFALNCVEITAVFLHNGMTQYLTDTKSKDHDFSFNSMDFEELAKQAQKSNLAYKNACMSIFTVGDETYFLKHNELLTEEVICLLSETAKILDESYRKQEKVFNDELQKVLDKNGNSTESLIKSKKITSESS